VAGWTGEQEGLDRVQFERPPRCLNPVEGVIVTANQSVIPGDEPYISAQFAVPSRAERLRELLLANPRMTPDEIVDHYPTITLADVHAALAYYWDHRDEIERAILREGPSSVAAVYLEPVQNSGGCFPPPPGYFQRVREICDRYGVLLVSDEVICAFGRLGYYFGSERYGYQPDIITFAKGLTSGYSPLGGMLVRDALVEPFTSGTATFLHGITFAGHPVSAAIALANLDLFEKEDLLGNVRANEAAFRATLEKLADLPIVGEVRGAGYFYGIELVKDKATRETFDDDESERLLRGFLSKALFEAGLYCRADDRGDPVIQLAPPLIVGQSEFDDIEQRLRSVLTEAGHRRARDREAMTDLPGPAQCAISAFDIAERPRAGLGCADEADALQSLMRLGQAGLLCSQSDILGSAAGQG